MTPDSAHPFKVHLIAHTHWDREWYQPVEIYRFRLIELFERLKRIVDSDAAYHSFFMDGQTVPIEDYLAVRPADEAVVRRLITSGKLRIGPFYILLDEQLVCGESYVRNLLIGQSMVGEYGTTASVGYLPDNFGHVSQTPQILLGFGIDNAVMWRGYTLHEDTPTEARWQGADGSEVLAALLVRGYASGAGMTPDMPESFDRAEESLRELKQRCGGQTLLLMHGVDHSFPHPQIREIIEYLTSRDDELEITHSDFESYLAEVRNGQTPYILTGEQLEAFHLDGTFSSRLHLKQENRICEMELTAYAEPLSALASLNGLAYPAEDMRRAWKTLIRCHAHDSITGCHANSVAEDMHVRLRRCHEIAKYLADNAFDHLLGQHFDEQNPADSHVISVFNPLPTPHRTVIRAEVFLPMETDVIRGLRISRGDEIYEANILEYEEVTWPLRSDYMVPKQLLHKRYTIEFGPVLLPPIGITSFRYEVVTDEATADNLMDAVKSSDDSGQDVSDTLCPRPHVLENACVRVEVRGDASIRVTDKRTGARYERLHVIEAQQDIGNLYNFAPPLAEARDYICPGRMELIENSSTSATLRIEGQLHIPEHQENVDRMSTPRRRCSVAVSITLKRDDPIIYFRTVLDNDSRKACIRARFDTQMSDAKNYVHTPFDVVERQPLSDDWLTVKERRITTGLTRYCAQEFTSVSDAAKSLTVLNRGLPEYTFHKGGLLTLTLLRSVNTIWGKDGRSSPVRDYPADTGHELGTHVREYGLLLHEEPIASSPDLVSALAYNRPPRVRLAREARTESLSLKLDPPTLVLTALKASEDGQGLVMRLHNVLDEATECRITLPRKFKQVLETRLDETCPQSVAEDCDTVEMMVPAKKIVTLKLIP